MGLKHENLRSEPQHAQRKPGVVVLVCNPSTGGGGRVRQILKVRWPAKATKMVRTGSVRKSVSKDKVEARCGSTLASICTYMHMRMHEPESYRFQRVVPLFHSQHEERAWAMIVMVIVERLGLGFSS